MLLGVAYGAVLLASWSTDTLHLMMPGSLEEGLKGGHSTAQQMTSHFMTVQHRGSHQITLQHSKAEQSTNDDRSSQSNAQDGGAEQGTTQHNVSSSGPCIVAQHASYDREADSLPHPLSVAAAADSVVVAVAAVIRWI
jgi:hypothetical protein